MLLVVGCTNSPQSWTLRHVATRAIGQMVLWGADEVLLPIQDWRIFSCAFS